MDEDGLRIRFAGADDVRLAALAPAHWRRKAAEKRFQKDRNQELAAGGLLADMLIGIGVAADGELAIAEGPGGKPVLRDFPGVHFSISHTDGLVMCVVAKHPVGCDVERLVPLDDDLRREIGSLEEWTRREARFKCGQSSGEPRNVPAPVGYCAAIAQEG